MSESAASSESSDILVVAPGEPGLDLVALVRDAEAAAAALRETGGWSAADDAEMTERFEAAATQALRVPALEERAATLRRLARRVVPPSARPLAWRAVRHADALTRHLFALVEHRVDPGRRR